MNLKTIIAGFVSIFIHLSISTSEGVGIGLDYKGGLSLSKIRGKDMERAEKAGADIKIHLGANGGVGVGIDFGKFISVQPEIFFAMKGYTAEIGEVEVMNILSVDSKISINYLEIPVLFKINLPARTVTPNFYIGPSLGIFLNAQSKEKVKFTDEMKELGIEDIDTTSDLTDMYKSIDFGLSMGGGIGIKAGKGRFIIDIRYTLGFLEIRKPIEYQLNGGDLLRDEIKNGSLSINLGYGINFGS